MRGINIWACWWRKTVPHRIRRQMPSSFRIRQRTLGIPVARRAIRLGSPAGRLATTTTDGQFRQAAISFTCTSHLWIETTHPHMRNSHLCPCETWKQRKHSYVADTWRELVSERGSSKHEEKKAVVCLPSGANDMFYPPTTQRTRIVCSLIASLVASLTAASERTLLQPFLHLNGSKQP